MTTKRTKASCTSQFTRSSSKGRVVAVKVPRRRSPDLAQPYSDDQAKAPQNAPHRPVAKQPIPTTPKTAAGVVPEIASATREPASVNSTLSFHPMAQIFPLLSDDGLQALANDIAQHGLLDEIVLYEGEILDGRCRYLGCERVGVAPRFQDYLGDDPLGFVISRNVHRRHLTKTQRALAAARAATLPVGANQNTPGLPIGRAAKIFEVSERNIARAKGILRHGAADLVQAVESGKVAISRAAELCELAEEKQIAGVQEIAERKRNPRKKKESAAGVNENTADGQIDEARPPECSPRADGDDLGIPEFLDRRDAASVARENEAAYASLTAAWSDASNSVRLKFVEEVVREFMQSTQAAQQ